MNHQSSGKVSSTGRRALGIAVATLLLAGMGGGHVVIDRGERTKIDGEARRQAAETSRRLPDIWSAYAETLSLLARSASTNPPFAAAIRGRVDQAQLREVIDDAWWAPYRSASAAVSYDGQSLAFAQDREAAVVAIEVLAQSVRQEGDVAVRALVANHRPVLVAAAPIAISRRVAPALVLMSQPIDRQMLDAVAARLGAPVLLEGVDAQFGGGGSPDDWVRLVGAVRRGGLDRATPDGIPWAATAVPVGQGLWLWTGATPADFARELAVNDLGAKLMLWSLAAMLATVVLLMAFRRKAAPVRASAEASGVDDAPARPSGSGIFLGRYELLERILDPALAVAPAERYQSAAQFRAAIAPHLDGGKAELATALATTFGEDLQLEQARLARACPRTVTPAPAAA